MNNANDVSVPYSLSNRSSSGVKARTFMIMCMKPRCINGYVFVRYTLSVAQCLSAQTQSHRWIYSNLIWCKKLSYSLLLSPTSSGTRAPHALKSHFVSAITPTNHVATIAKMATRVNSGSLRT